MFRGTRTLKVWATTQATVALSSAEAELIAAARSASEGMAMRAWCKTRAPNARCGCP